MTLPPTVTPWSYGAFRWADQPDERLRRPIARRGRRLEVVHHGNRVVDHQTRAREREPGEAFALAQRLEIHHTPKHGSWLNIAEIELSALSRQCLDRRISDLDTLNAELAAWQRAINAEHRQIRWQFITDDARVKLRHLYPKS